MGEIRMFAANFAPKYWAFCQGQLMPINQNQALFSILGTTYGGNGVNNFALPDLGGRIPLGTSQEYTLGEKSGTNAVTLMQANLPAHHHNGQLTGAPKLFVSDNIGDKSKPNTGLSLARHAISSGRAKANTKVFVNEVPTIALANTSIDLTSLKVTNEPFGGGQPHNNMQPYIGINYIICLMGVFPSRS